MKNDINVSLYFVGSYNVQPFGRGNVKQFVNIPCLVGGFSWPTTLHNLTSIEFLLFMCTETNFTYAFQIRFKVKLHCTNETIP